MTEVDSNKNKNKTSPPNKSIFKSAGSGSKGNNNVLTNASPPWHAILLVTGIIAFSTNRLLSLSSSSSSSSSPSSSSSTITFLESLDEMATMDTFTKSMFPTIVGVKTLGWVRLIFAMIIWCVTLQKTYGNESFIIQTIYLSSSKLQPTNITFHGWNKQWAFTNWCWNMLGVYCTCSAVLSLWVAYNHTDCFDAEGNTNDPDGGNHHRCIPAPVIRWMVRIAIISWEIAAPQALLVSITVKYVIWDSILKSHGNTQMFKSISGSLLPHTLNSFIVLLESGLLGNIPIALSHLPLPILFGCVYVLFSWAIRHQWTNDDNKADGPQFIYFYLDTTLPGFQTTIALILLLITLALYYLFFVFLYQLLSSSEPFFLEDMFGTTTMVRIIPNACIVVIMLTIVLRFRD